MKAQEDFSPPAAVWEVAVAEAAVEEWAAAEAKGWEAAAEKGEAWVAAVVAVEKKWCDQKKIELLNLTLMLFILNQGAFQYLILRKSVLLLRSLCCR